MALQPRHHSLRPVTNNQADEHDSEVHALTGLQGETNPALIPRARSVRRFLSLKPHDTVSPTKSGDNGSSNYILSHNEPWDRDEDQNSYHLHDLNFEPSLSSTPTKRPSPTAQMVNRTSPMPTSRSGYQDLSSNKRESFLRYWWLEILTCFLMVGILFAIVAILYRYQGNPLPQWPFRISINTLVSILATIFKIAMLFIISQGLSQLKWQWFMQSRPLQDLARFDAASRGPLGCLQLLTGLRGLHPVASWGAILVILSIALDPFVQQLIHYVNCPQVKPNILATIPRASLYGEAGSHISANDWPPATPVLSYVNQGIYNPAEIKTPFSCSTGNCTFEDTFRTLGYCATCEDLTSDLSFYEVNITDTTDASQTFLWVYTTLPSGSYASWQGGSVFTQSWFTMNFTGQWIEMILAASDLPGKNLTWTESHYISSVLRNVALGESACITTYDNNTWACNNNAAGAARCRFDPCVRTYRANVSYGEIQEELIDTNLNMFIGWGYSPYTYTMADLGCAGSDVVEQLQASGYEITDPTALIPWNIAINDGKTNYTAYVNQSSDNIPPDFANNVTIPGPMIDGVSLPLNIVPAKCIYQMDWPAVSSLSEYLGTTLNGSIQPSNNFDAVYGPTAVRAIFNDSYVSFDSVNFTFQAIAESITNRIREYGLPPLNQYSEPVTGVTWENATCVEVKWTYFIFPSILVGLTVFLLIAVILKTELGEAKYRVHGWKASLWPLVFSELIIEKADQNELEITTRGSPDMMLKEMDNFAKRTTAQLRTASKQR